MDWILLWVWRVMNAFLQSAPPFGAMPRDQMDLNFTYNSIAGRSTRCQCSGDLPPRKPKHRHNFTFKIFLNLFLKDRVTERRRNNREEKK